MEAISTEQQPPAAPPVRAARPHAAPLAAMATSGQSSPPVGPVAPDVSVPEGRPPAASQDGETRSDGSGSCTAAALSAIGVFASAAEAARGLDAQIAPLHEKLCRERGSCAESEAGVRGEQWHPEATKRAVVAAGWHIRTLAIDPAQPTCVDLKTVLRSGSYLLVGVTNNRVEGQEQAEAEVP